MKLSREKVDLKRATKCMTVAAMAEAYGVSRARRISDRLNRLCIPLHFPEESIRAKTAEEENRNFIQSILQNG